MDSKYGVDPPGHVKGVRPRNIAWEVSKPILLGGFSQDNLVEGITFENCTVSGRPLSAQTGVIKKNEFVRDVTVQ
jgi:hypothetical protein